MQKNFRKLITVLLAIFVVIPTVVMAFNVFPKPSLKDIQVDGIVLNPPKAIGNFHLIANNGKPFTKENLKGHWTMMFFGFTHCGMVCPSTLAALNQTYKKLQGELPENQLPQVVMVSVDPDRDSVARMNEYVNSFNSHFIGTRAEMPETIALEKQLHIVAARMEAEGQKNRYTINHSAEIIVINPEAKVIAYLSYPHMADEMVKDYKSLLSAR